MAFEKQVNGIDERFERRDVDADVEVKTGRLLEVIYTPEIARSLMPS